MAIFHGGVLLAWRFHAFTPWRDCDHETGNPLAGFPLRYDKLLKMSSLEHFHEISGLAL